MKIIALLEASQIRQKELEDDIARLRAGPETSESLRAALKMCVRNSPQELDIWTRFQRYIETPAPTLAVDKGPADQVSGSASFRTLHALLVNNESSTFASLVPGTKMPLHPLLAALLPAGEVAMPFVPIDTLPVCLELIHRFALLGTNARILTDHLFHLPAVPQQGGGRPQRAEYERARELLRKCAGNLDGRSVQMVSGYVKIGATAHPFSFHAAGRAVLYAMPTTEGPSIVENTCKRVSTYFETIPDGTAVSRGRFGDPGGRDGCTMGV